MGGTPGSIFSLAAVWIPPSPFMKVYSLFPAVFIQPHSRWAHPLWMAHLKVKTGTNYIQTHFGVNFIVKTLINNLFEISGSPKTVKSHPLHFSDAFRPFNHQVHRCITFVPWSVCNNKASKQSHMTSASPVKSTQTNDHLTIKTCLQQLQQLS